MNNDRLKKQIDFIIEIDKLKQVFRQSILIGDSRNENDSEHSWHLAVMAMLLSEYSKDSIDVLKVIKMLLIHDIVEIDANDTFCYDEKANEDKAERELKAAERIFNILPQDQAEEIWSLWREFEEMKTPEARFAASMDRLEPILLNYNTNGHTWKKPNVTSEKVYKRAAIMEDSVPKIYELVKGIIEDSIKKGFLRTN